MRIAFQGEYGAYSEQAIYKEFGKDQEVVPCQSLNLVFAKVNGKQVQLGVVPIENSVGGGIDQAYDLLRSYQLYIIGEIYLTVKHCLLGNKGSSINQIRYVYSHPQALRQCERFLSELKVKRRASYDTAGSAKMIKKRERLDEAAIAGKVAAKHYGLIILREQIESYHNNVTRFSVISTKKAKKSSGKKHKTSIIFEATDTPGSLHKCLGVFATRDINLTMLQSRPIKGADWKYLFYLDFEGHLEDQPVKNSLAELKKFTISYKILGSYPQGNIEG